MRKLNEKEIESVSGALAQDAAPPKQNTEAIQSAQNKSTLTPFIAAAFFITKTNHVSASIAGEPTNSSMPFE